MRLSFRIENAKGSAIHRREKIGAKKWLRAKMRKRSARRTD
jgi:hypothetical protein